MKKKIKWWQCILIGLGILFLFLGIPYTVNSLLLEDKWFDVVGYNETSRAWLGFWGGYLGSVISAGVAFIILNKQLNNNHEENERNRKIQLKAIEHQQETEWLKIIRKACIDNIDALNHNNLINVRNTIFKDINLAYNSILQCIENANRALYGYELSKRKEGEVIYQILHNYHADYHEIAVDIREVCIAILNYKSKSLETQELIKLLLGHDRISKDLKDLLNHILKITNEESFENIVKHHIHCKIENYLNKKQLNVNTEEEEDLKGILFFFINTEQTRINNILNDTDSNEKK